MSENKTKSPRFVLYSGAYLNKGGAAIAYGTLKVLTKLDIIDGSIIDPEPQFPIEFFDSYNLNQIYRYSDTLSTVPLKSISPIYLAKPFIKCLLNSNMPDIKNLHASPIWHIGDSPFSDYRSSLSIIGQVIALHSLKRSINGKVIIGGISLEYPRTKIGELVLKHFFKSVDYFYIRGTQTRNNLIKLGVPKEKMSIICDFAYHLDKHATPKTDTVCEPIRNSDKNTIALILRDYSSGSEKQNYINNLKHLISELENTYNVFLIPTSYAYLIPENDLIFVEKLGVKSHQIVNIRDFTPEEIISIFSNFDIIISTRLHGAVIGSLANVPTIHLYEGRKSLEVITEIFGKKTVPLVKLSAFANSDGPDKMIETIKDITLRKKAISEKMKSCIKIAREKAIDELKYSLQKIFQ